LQIDDCALHRHHQIFYQSLLPMRRMVNTFVEY
jgi:hypothetical protein